MIVSNPRIQRWETIKSDHYEWVADVLFKNNSNDTIIVNRALLGNYIIFDIKFYIVIGDNVYVGEQIGEYISELYKIMPGESLPSLIYFVLPKNYIKMDDLYVYVTIKYESEYSPYDQMPYLNPLPILKKDFSCGISNKFHITDESSVFSPVNINLDSLILVKDYNIQHVKFW
jgi:hypothetical protein